MEMVSLFLKPIVKSRNHRLKGWWTLFKSCQSSFSQRGGISSQFTPVNVQEWNKMAAQIGSLGSWQVTSRPQAAWKTWKWYFPSGYVFRLFNLSTTLKKSHFCVSSVVISIFIHFFSSVILLIINRIVLKWILIFVFVFKVLINV